MSTAQLVHPADARPSADPSHPIAEPARISFRQPVSTGGYVDAAWWPRSLDLGAELPALMDVLWTAGREINRITYNLRAWDPAPRRIQIEGRTVRLGGFASSDPITVRLSDPWGGERVDVLVVAPDTDPAVAQRIFDLVSRADNPDRPRDILDRATGTPADGATRS